MSSLPSIQSSTARLVFFVVLLLSIFIFMLALPNISVPFIIAYILTLMLRPLRSIVYSRSFKKRTLYTLMTIGMLFLFIYPIVEVIPKINAEASNIQYYLPKLESFLRDKYSFIVQQIQQKTGIEITKNLMDDLIAMAEKNTKAILLYLPSMVRLLLEWSFLIPIFMFFLMRDGKAVMSSFLRVVPNEIFEKTYYLFHQFNTKFGDYIFAKFIEASIVGILTTVGLIIIGFPFAFLLGIFAGVTNIVPYVGPILGFIPAAIIALVDGGSNYSLGAVIILYSVANIIDLALVFPILVSKIVNLHPAVVIVSVMVGSQFAGVLGMVLSIPFTAFLKLLITEVYYGIYPSDYSG